MSEFFDTPLSDVIALQNDKKAQLKTSEYQSSGVLPIIDQSSKFICGYTDDFSKKYSKSLPVIVFGDHTLHTKYIDFDFAVGADGTQIIRTQDPQHEHKYLYYVISREIQIMGSEGYKRHLKILKERVVPFTNSIPEQKKIASILTSVDEVIENAQKQIDKLQDLKKATMNELLTKGIGHTEFKDSELGRIPKSWEIIDISSVTKVIDCKHATPKYFEEGYPVVKPGNIQEGKINLSGCSLTDKEGFDNLNENHKPVIGDIVYSRNQTYGIGAYVDRRMDFCIGQDVCIIHPTLIDPLYTYYVVNSPTVKNQVEALSAGSTFKRINLGAIRKLLLPLPPKEEQKKIASLASSVDQQIKTHKEKKEGLLNLKKSLMQDLLTGKVRVTVN